MLRRCEDEIDTCYAMSVRELGEFSKKALISSQSDEINGR